MIAAILALAAGTATAPSIRKSQILKDWALSRCIGRASGKPFQDDAYKSSAAMLEKSSAGTETFGAIDKLIDKTLARTYSGLVPGRYAMLKCIDLYHSGALDRLTSHPAR